MTATAPPSAAGTVVSTDNTVTMDLHDVPLGQVLQLFTEQRALNLVASQALEGKISVKFDRVPWDQALTAVLKTQGLGYQRLGSILQVEPLDKITPELLTRVYQLKNVSPSEVREMVQALLTPRGKQNILQRAGLPGIQGSSLVITDAQVAHERIVSFLEKVDTPSPAERMHLGGPDSQGLYSADIRNIPYARVFDELRARFDLNIVEDSPIEGRMSMTVQSVSKDELLDTMLGTNPLRYLKEGTTYRVATAAQFRERLVTRVFSLKYVDANDLKRFLVPHVTPLGKVEIFTKRSRAQYGYGNTTSSGPRRQTAQGVVGAGNTGQSGTGTTSDLDRSSELSVTDTPAAVENIAALVTKLDVRPAQVSIDVKIVEVTLEKNETLGISWNVESRIKGATKPTNFPFIGRGPSNSQNNDTLRYGTLSAEQFEGVLQMLGSRNRLRIVSSPRISTLNNQEASILIGSKFPITVETIDPQTAVRTVTLDRYEQIGIQLVVIPQVAGNDSLNLVIHPAVSSIGPIIDQKFPIIQTREADTQVLVKNGDTAVIGGLLEQRDEKGHSYVPGLGQIPIVGKLFQQDREDSRIVDLLIFVTPNIVPEDPTKTAAASAAEQASRKPTTLVKPRSVAARARSEAAPVWMNSLALPPDVKQAATREEAAPAAPSSYEHAPAIEDVVAPAVKADAGTARAPVEAPVAKAAAGTTQAPVVKQPNQERIQRITRMLRNKRR